MVVCVGKGHRKLAWGRGQRGSAMERSGSVTTGSSAQHLLLESNIVRSSALDLEESVSSTYLKSFEIREMFVHGKTHTTLVHAPVVCAPEIEECC